MDFGMPTLIDLKSLEACAVLCKELDLQFVELNMDLPEYQVDMLDLTQLADITKRFGIYYTIHLEDTASPWDFNKRIAAAYIETILQTIEIAETDKHSGFEYALSSRRIFYSCLIEKRIYLRNIHIVSSETDCISGYLHGGYR